MAQDRDVVVVGGGVAGLVAAATAAESGASVLLLDARRSAGGRARTHEVDGYLHNEGPHALYLGGELNAALRRFGVPVRGGDPARGTYGGLSADGETVPVPLTAGQLLGNQALGLRDKAAMGRLLGGLAVLRPARHADRSAAEWLDATVRPGLGRSMVHALVRLATYVPDLDRLSADAAIVQLQRAASTGVRYLDGGWVTVVDGLLRAAAARGVALAVRRPVRQVRRSADGRAWSVESDDGDVVEARSVILAAGGPGLAAQLAAEAAPVLAEWAARAVPVTASHLDVGVHGAWHGPSVVLGLDRPTYLSVHAPLADLAPGGTTMVSAMRYHLAGETPDPNADRCELEGLLDRVRPGWQDQRPHIRFGARLVVAHDRPRPETGGLAGRPGPEVPAAGGLYVAGDWVGPEGNLADAAAASGARAGALAAGRSSGSARSSEAAAAAAARMAP
ncbi:MAG: FAD-dependent oxidoreductase [Actinobacteria bacterium]|nr:FAD-dependent oxidoreductase [Actinomycetota bacterium]